MNEDVAEDELLEDDTGKKDTQEQGVTTETNVSTDKTAYETAAQIAKNQSALSSSSNMEEMVRSVLATMLANLILANVMPPPPNAAQPRQAKDEEERRWIELNKAYPTPSETRIYKDHEKLEGRKNYKSWLEMIQLDLRAAFLQPFIEEEFAQEKVKVSFGRRRALDAQAVQQIRSSLSRKVLMTVGPVNSAFELMEQLKRDHGFDKR